MSTLFKNKFAILETLNKKSSKGLVVKADPSTRKKKVTPKADPTIKDNDKHNNASTAVTSKKAKKEEEEGVNSLTELKKRLEQEKKQAAAAAAAAAAAVHYTETSIPTDADNAPRHPQEAATTTTTATTTTATTAEGEAAAVAVVPAADGGAADVTAAAPAQQPPAKAATPPPAPIVYKTMAEVEAERKKNAVVLKSKSRQHIVDTEVHAHATILPRKTDEIKVDLVKENTPPHNNNKNNKHAGTNATKDKNAKTAVNKNKPQEAHAAEKAKKGEAVPLEVFFDCGGKPSSRGYGRGRGSRGRGDRVMVHEDQCANLDSNEAFPSL